MRALLRRRLRVLKVCLIFWDLCFFAVCGQQDQRCRVWCRVRLRSRLSGLGCTLQNRSFFVLFPGRELFFSYAYDGLSEFFNA